MPPQRTIPPAKAIKTERTHEENQERAYIAASRRSDRSLEARVESARRASEIHKRRTGRSLRVTEQDVVNEEMYEEEDDDLPMQYRRLTAHLQTGSADFNRRLAAYLTNHVAMRSALDQAITNSYAQQYPNAPQFAHNQQTMFPSPLMTQNLGQQPPQQHSPQSQMQHQKPQQQSPHPYRSSPYPTPGTPGFRQNSHGRSMSTSSPHEVHNLAPKLSNSSTVQAAGSSDVRRMSMPASCVSPNESRTSQLLHTSSSTLTSPKEPPGVKNETVTSQPMQPPPIPQQSSSSVYQDYSPFSTSLPMESQMLLGFGSTLDPSDPLTSMLMAGNDNMPQQHFNFSPQLATPKYHPSYDGMSATLAPSALDVSPSHLSYTDSSSATNTSSSTPSFNYAFDNSLGDFKGVSFNTSSSAHGSGSVTPGADGGWDAYINDSSWTENAA